MDTDRYIEFLRSDVASMASAARTAGLSVDVPTCPGWDVRDLIIHTGVVHRHKVETLLGDYQDKPAPLPEVPADDVSDGDVMAWFLEGGAQLLEACAGADLEEPTWTWCPHDHTKAWWVARMAHETVIHRVDAVIAGGETPTIDPWLAGEGVAEILEEFMVGGPSWGTVTPMEQRIRLVAPGRSWDLQLATFSGTSPYSGKTHEGLPSLLYDSADVPMATVSADAPTLDLWLWGRGPLPDDAVTGDISVVGQLRSTAAESTG